MLVVEHVCKVRFLCRILLDNDEDLGSQTILSIFYALQKLFGSFVFALLYHFFNMLYLSLLVKYFLPEEKKKRSSMCFVLPRLQFSSNYLAVVIEFAEILKYML